MEVVQPRCAGTDIPKRERWCAFGFSGVARPGGGHDDDGGEMSNRIQLGGVSITGVSSLGMLETLTICSVPVCTGRYPAQRLTMWPAVGGSMKTLSAHWLAISYGLYVVLATVLGHRDVAGFATLVALIAFLLGLVIIILGIIGEYLSRIFDEVTTGPEAVVDEVY
jgi:hypothetical protein